MKVICIDVGNISSDGLPGNIQCNEQDYIKEGEEYDVVDTFIEDGYCWYVLKQDLGFGYDSRRFSQLSETESAVKEASKIVNEVLKVV